MGEERKAWEKEKQSFCEQKQLSEEKRTAFEIVKKERQVAFEIVKEERKVGHQMVQDERRKSSERRREDNKIWEEERQKERQTWAEERAEFDSERAGFDIEREEWKAALVASHTREVKERQRMENICMEQKRRISEKEEAKLRSRPCWKCGSSLDEAMREGMEWERNCWQQERESWERQRKSWEGESKTLKSLMSKEENSSL